MSKLLKLQEKYPKAKYEPAEDCKKCDGKGEFYLAGNSTFRPSWSPCACIFIEHDFLPIFKETMSATISKMKKDLNNRGIKIK